VECTAVITLGAPFFVPVLSTIPKNQTSNNKSMQSRKNREALLLSSIQRNHTMSLFSLCMQLTAVLLRCPCAGRWAPRRAAIDR